jgi:hypothetical protein
VKNLREAILVLALSALLAGCESPGDDRAGEPAGGEPLFDGRTLNGWIQRGGNATYHVEDNAIVGTATREKQNTFLCTEQHYSDFVLELEFKIDTGLNSGVQIRSNSLADYRAGRVHGYQVEIDPSERAWTGGIFDEGRRDWLFDLSKNEPARKAFKSDQWNHFRIEAVGDSIKTWLNGTLAADLTDPMTASGFIALQVHGVENDLGLQVRWRNLRIQEQSH